MISELLYNCYMTKQTNVRLSEVARSQMTKAKQVYPFLKTDASVIEFALNQLSSLIDRNYFNEIEQAMVNSRKPADKLHEAEKVSGRLKNELVSGNLTYMLSQLKPNTGSEKDGKLHGTALITDGKEVKKLTVELDE